jgi:uncharacterized protein YxjI
MPSRSGRGHSEDPGTRSAPEGSRYVLREKLLSLGDDFWIENEHGERAFFVDDKVLRVRDAYGVAVAPGQDDALVLAVTVCIDHLTSKDR